MTKNYKCPHCGQINKIDEPSWVENFGENLPENLGKAILITAAGAVTAGIGGLILGGVFYGGAVVKYVNGTKATCGYCGEDFRL